MLVGAAGNAGETAASVADAAENEGPFNSFTVNIDKLKLFACADNELICEFDVVTGWPGKETHAGRFYTTRKYEDYTSMTDDVEMPYTMFFTEHGKAVHGTKWATVRSYLHAYSTESVGSQRCAGLSGEDAKALFEWAPLKTGSISWKKNRMTELSMFSATGSAGYRRLPGWSIARTAVLR